MGPADYEVWNKTQQVYHIKLLKREVDREALFVAASLESDKFGPGVPERGSEGPVRMGAGLTQMQQQQEAQLVQQVREIFSNSPEKT